MARFDDAFPEDVRDIAERLSESRATFTALELDGLNGRLRRRFERTPRRRSLVARMRAKWVASLLALGLLLTSGAGIVIASSAIGGGRDTFRTIRFDDADDASGCQLDGSHEEFRSIRTGHRRLLVIITFDCHRIIIHIDFDGEFGFSFGDGLSHSGDGSWTGNAPGGSPGLTISEGHSHYHFPFR